MRLKKWTLKKFILSLYHSKLIYQHLEFILKKKITLYNFQLKDIYILPRKVTINAYLRSFQYKILNNVPYLNKNLHALGLSNTQLCSSCKMKEETISYLFCYCTHIHFSESTSGLFHRLFNFFKVNTTDCYIWLS